MTEKPTTTKHKTTPAKPSAATRKSATEKPASAKPVKKNKKKIVRDSFTMPQNDYAKIVELKQVCLEAGVHMKKSELLRAGLHTLGKLSVAQLKRAIAQM